MSVKIGDESKRGGEIVFPFWAKEFLAAQKPLKKVIIIFGKLNLW